LRKKIRLTATARAGGAATRYSSTTNVHQCVYVHGMRMHSIKPWNMYVSIHTNVGKNYIKKDKKKQQQEKKGSFFSSKEYRADYHPAAAASAAAKRRV